MPPWRSFSQLLFPGQVIVVLDCGSVFTVSEGVVVGKSAVTVRKRVQRQLSQKQLDDLVLIKNCENAFDDGTVSDHVVVNICLADNGNYQ